MANTRVVICIPHGGRVAPEFYRHIFLMQNAWLNYDFMYAEVDMMIIGKARNDLVTQARLGEADVALFLDDDILIPPHTGVLIQQALDLGVVSGLYFNRRPPYTPQLYNRATEEKYLNQPSVLYWPADHYEPGLSTFDAVGGGCLAVRMDVFASLEAHAQAQAQHRANAIATLRKLELNGDGWALDVLAEQLVSLSPWFEFTNVKGEDLYFCERLREIGQQVWVNADVKCEHLGVVPIAEHHFNYLKDNNLLRRVE